MFVADQSTIYIIVTDNKMQYRWGSQKSFAHPLHPFWSVMPPLKYYILSTDLLSLWQLVSDALCRTSAHANKSITTSCNFRSRDELIYKRARIKLAARASRHVILSRECALSSMRMNTLSGCQTPSHQGLVHLRITDLFFTPHVGRESHFTIC